MKKFQIILLILCSLATAYLVYYNYIRLSEEYHSVFESQTEAVQDSLVMMPAPNQKIAIPEAAPIESQTSKHSAIVDILEALEKLLATISPMAVPVIAYYTQKKLHDNKQKEGAIA